MTAFIPTILPEQIRERSRPSLRVVCAWCDAAPQPQTGQQVSHGICRDCAVQFFGIDLQEAAAG